MKTRASEFIAEVTANNRDLLYRCRWSKEDAQRVVPKLTAVLSDADPTIVQEALRSLFTIGTPAASAAPAVAPLVEAHEPMTRSLAVLALGQIAHKEPERCVGPITAALKDQRCRQNALRILAFLGSRAKSSLSEVISCYASPDAKTRKLAVKAALAINKQDPATQALILKGTKDRSTAVRTALAKAAKTSQPILPYWQRPPRTAPRRAEPGASPNGGPAERFGNSGVGGGPPSVS